MSAIKVQCKTCKFFDQATDVDDFLGRGWCRAHPPHAAFEADDLDQGSPTSIFPMVASTDWCGEWEARR